MYFSAVPDIPALVLPLGYAVLSAPNSCRMPPHTCRTHCFCHREPAASLLYRRAVLLHLTTPLSAPACHHLPHCLPQDWCYWTPRWGGYTCACRLPWCCHLHRPVVQHPPACCLGCYLRDGPAWPAYTPPAPAAYRYLPPPDFALPPPPPAPAACWFRTCPPPAPPTWIGSRFCAHRMPACRSPPLPPPATARVHYHHHCATAGYTACATVFYCRGIDWIPVTFHPPHGLPVCLGFTHHHGLPHLPRTFSPPPACHCANLPPHHHSTTLTLVVTHAHCRSATLPTGLQLIGTLCHHLPSYRVACLPPRMIDHYCIFTGPPPFAGGMMHLPARLYPVGLMDGFPACRTAIPCTQYHVSTATAVGWDTLPLRRHLVGHCTTTAGVRSTTPPLGAPAIPPRLPAYHLTPRSPLPGGCTALGLPLPTCRHRARFYLQVFTAAAARMVTAHCADLPPPPHLRRSSYRYHHHRLPAGHHTPPGCTCRTALPATAPPAACTTAAARSLLPGAACLPFYSSPPPACLHHTTYCFVPWMGHYLPTPMVWDVGLHLPAWMPATYLLPTAYRYACNCCRMPLPDSAPPAYCTCTPFCSYHHRTTCLPRCLPPLPPATCLPPLSGLTPLPATCHPAPAWTGGLEGWGQRGKK